jgi:hypothetical protein
MARTRFLACFWIAAGLSTLLPVSARAATLSGDFVRTPPCEITYPPCTASRCGSSNPVRFTDTVTIDAEPGEADGEPAPLCATWLGAVSAVADAGAAAAAASGGGEPDASFRAGPYEATASTSTAAFVSIDGAPPLPMGEQLSVDGAQPGVDETGEFSRTLYTEIGQSVFLSVAAACAAAAPGGSTAAASASSQITLRLGPCEPLPPVTQVPTMSQWSLIVTALLLAALGYLGLRQRQK